MNKYEYLLPPVYSYESAIRQREVYFLFELYHSLNLPEKPSVHNWFHDDESDYCQFTGVLCDWNSLVMSLDLSDLGLTGTLPSSFEPLTLLRRLILRNNSIGGILPTSVPATLIHWNLSQNRFHGPVLQAENEMLPSKLKRLILSGNLLSGTIPQDLCKLDELRALHLSNNRFISGTLPECLGELPQLQALRIRNTNLIGPIPATVCPAENRTSGVCNPWEFCTDGYREVFPPSNSTVTCQSCEGQSNRIASPFCEQLIEPASPYPTETLSSIPSDGPSVIPSSIPTSGPSTISAHQTLHPSVHPSSRPTLLLPQSDDPSSSPSCRPSLQPSITPSAKPSLRGKAPESFYPSVRIGSTAPSWTDRLVEHPSLSPLPIVESSSPSLHQENDGTFHGAVGGSSQTSSETDFSKQGPFALFPVTLLVFCLGLAAALFVVTRRAPQAWQRRRERRFRMLPNDQSGDGGGPADEEHSSTLSPRHAEAIPKGKYCASNGGNDGFPTVPVPVRRPCIVCPGTLSPNPKVRFFLDARSESSFGDDMEDDEQGLDMHTSACKDRASASKSLESTGHPISFASVFRSPCDIYDGREEADQVTTSSSPDFIPSSNCSKSADSSVSSTTPMLNSLDKDIRNNAMPRTNNKPDVDGQISNSACVPPRIDMPSCSVDSMESTTCDIGHQQPYTQEQPLENSRGASSAKRRGCFQSAIGASNPKDDGHQEHDEPIPHHEITPPLLHRSPAPYSRSRALCTGFPLLGIRPHCARTLLQDDAVEIVEIYHTNDVGPKRRWLEVTDIHT
jgi:hypothetical protein